MEKEINLTVPNSLYYALLREADERGVPFEALCLSLLSQEQEERELIDPAYYINLNHSAMRSEIRKVIESDLPPDEVRRRVNHLELQVSRRYIRK